MRSASLLASVTLFCCLVVTLANWNPYSYMYYPSYSYRGYGYQPTYYNNQGYGTRYGYNNGYYNGYGNGYRGYGSGARHYPGSGYYPGFGYYPGYGYPWYGLGAFYYRPLYMIHGPFHYGYHGHYGVYQMYGFGHGFHGNGFYGNPYSTMYAPFPAYPRYRSQGILDELGFGRGGLLKLALPAVLLAALFRG